MAIDPICKMTVDEKTAGFSSELKGVTYYFCSAMCKKSFDELEESKIRVAKFLKARKRDPFGRLLMEIIRPGVCTLCGACVASCPEKVLVIEAGKPKLIGKCTACSVCYNQCPRTITTEIDLIGHFKKAYTAKAMLPEVKGQDGGAVTALLIYALDEGLIDSAIVTMKSENEPWKPVPTMVQTKEEVLKSSGSIYTHSTTIDCLTNAIREGSHSIGFVGTPCNIDAVYKMQNSPYGLLHLFMRTNVLKLGLFCMDAFDYNGLKRFLEQKGIDLKTIKKMKIYKGKLRVLCQQAEKVFDIKELDRIRCSSCMFCTDLTSEKADISFGAVGSSEGYTTVLARTGLGLEILQEAANTGYIKTAPLKMSRLEEVLHLARIKKVQMYSIKRRSQQ